MSIWLPHTPPLAPFSSSALILIIPVKLQTALCTPLCFFAAAYSLCHSSWQGRQEAQHSFSPRKGRPVQLDKYYFPLLTASPVKLVLYYFFLSCSLLLLPLVITLPQPQRGSKHSRCCRFAIPGLKTSSLELDEVNTAHCVSWSGAFDGYLLNMTRLERLTAGLTVHTGCLLCLLPNLLKYIVCSLKHLCVRGRARGLWFTRQHTGPH